MSVFPLLCSAVRRPEVKEIVLLSKLPLVTLAYFITGWLGLQVPYAGTHITLIWLPTGIAVAALLRWQRTLWPGIWLGAFLVNLSIGSGLPVAASIATGNTLGPLLCVYWLRRTRFSPAFDHQKDVGAFIAGAALGMAISASCGVLSLYMGDLLPLETIGSAWLAWWMGDSVGVLLAAPLLLTLTRKNIRQLGSDGRALVLWLLTAGTVAWLGFVQHFDDIGHSLPLAFVTLESALPHLRARRIRALGITSARRAPPFPQLPAIAESLPGFELEGFCGFVAPATG
jgi:integral membrane sensor domain MASE1